MSIMRPLHTLHSRILIAENHELVGEGLKQLLEPEFGILGIVASEVDIARCASALRPDLIICNLSILLPHGLDVAKRLKKLLPELKIIYLAVDNDPNLAVDAFRRGCASGYLLKTCSAAELAIAIRTVLRGHKHISPSLKDSVDRLLWVKGTRLNESTRLTARQLEILRLLLEGNSLKMVASALGLTSRTVAFHKYRIMEQVGVMSFADLVRFAERNQLLAEVKLPHS